jgi:hypothetical protein
MELIDVTKAFAPNGDFHGSERYGKVQQRETPPVPLAVDPEVNPTGKK